MSYACRICGNGSGNAEFSCREKMFGWGDAFVYFQCGSCGCLQIAGLPADLGRFYPPHYYSFHMKPVPQSGWRARVAGWRDGAMATGGGGLGGVIHRFSSAWPEVVALGGVPARREMRVLDVGCGRGALLSVLRRAGFGKLAGVDPYLREDVEVLLGLWVRKQSLETVPEEFDLIMLHHVFEHVWEGGEMLRACAQRLADGGRVLLRFPTPESEAWERYREDWVQLDAPRHLFLHTKRSLAVLARGAGLEIEKWFGDSSALQFWGSELYRQGVPLFDGQGKAARPEEHFSKAQLREFARAAAELNAAGRGDQVVVVLRRKPE